jgi:two-component system chemotaxis sensor kinase CheA
MASITAVLKVLIERLILDEIPDRPVAFASIHRGVLILAAMQKTRVEQAEAVDHWKTSLSAFTMPIQDTEEETKGSRAVAPSDPRGEPALEWELCQDFVVEALEHLGDIELHLIDLEQNPEDRDRINSIFRPFHNIKGVSGFLNLTQINRFAHEIETLIDGVRNDQLRVTPEFIDLVLSAVDQMKAMIIDLGNSLEIGDSLRQWDLEPHLQQIRKLQKWQRTGVSQESQPIGQILVENGKVSPVDVDVALEKQMGRSRNRRIGEILIEDGKTEPRHVVEALREQKAQISGTDALRGFSEAVKVDPEKLDTLVNMVGELVTVQSMIRQNPHVNAIQEKRLFQDLSHLSRTAAGLQKTVMSLRMVPVGPTFQKMFRLVRDLSRKSGKAVELNIEGDDIEIDRTTVEALYDPLVHMIRNAVDHGIEPPEVRKKIGKPELGSIRLRAYRGQGHVGIEVRDDGCGLDRDRILSRALEKGLIHPQDTLTERQIGSLIFLPGLSTSDEVTYVSGRGVGMDVVKKAVERLHGTVEVESEPCKGSVFRIRLPLALGIIDGLIVRVSRHRYIIPTEAVKASFHPKGEASVRVHGRGKTVQVGDTVLPLVRLHEVFNIKPEKTDPNEAVILVIRNQQRPFCLMVDDVENKHEVAIKALGEGWEGLPGVAAEMILEDGKMGLVLDVNSILGLSGKKGRRHLPSHRTNREVNRLTKSIISQRTVEKRLKS